MGKSAQMAEREGTAKNDFVQRFMAEVAAKNPGEKEFHQAVQEVVESLVPVLDRRIEYRKARIIERLVEPERVILFRVPWMDDKGRSASTGATGLSSPAPSALTKEACASTPASIWEFSSSWASNRYSRTA